MQEAGQPQCMQSHLDFAVARHAIINGNGLESQGPENAYAFSTLPESLLQSQQRYYFINQSLANPITRSLFAPCADSTPETLYGMAGFTDHAANPKILAPVNSEYMRKLGSHDLPEGSISSSCSYTESRKT